MHENAALNIAQEAVETLRRSSSKEALGRLEALRLQPLQLPRALGLRDMRFPAPLAPRPCPGPLGHRAEVLMRPESISWPVTRGARVALLCGATAGLTDQKLLKRRGPQRASAFHGFSKGFKR